MADKSALARTYSADSLLKRFMRQSQDRGSRPIPTTSAPHALEPWQDAIINVLEYARKQSMRDTVLASLVNELAHSVLKTYLPPGVQLPVNINPPFLCIPHFNVVKSVLDTSAVGKATVKATIAQISAGLWDLQHQALRRHAEKRVLLLEGICGADVRDPFEFSWTHGTRTVSVSAMPWSFEADAQAAPRSNWKPVSGRSIGTCFRELNVPQSRQLVNLYLESFEVRGETQYTYRHGVVDTEDKALQLASLLSLHHNSTRRIRFLNILSRKSDAGEESMWHQERIHTQLILNVLNRTLSPEEMKTAPFTVVHMSLQANNNTTFDWWNHGECSNSVYNVVGWCQYVIWACVDMLRLIRSLEGVLSTMQDTVFLLESLMEELGGVMEQHHLMDLERLYGTLWYTRFGFYSGTNPVYVLLRRLSQRDLPSYVAALEAVRCTAPDAESELAIMRLSLVFKMLAGLLSSQYPPVPSLTSSNPQRDNNSLSRINEFMLLCCLDRLLNVTASVNCKSGCDRAGLVHALTNALHMVLNTRGPEEEEDLHQVFLHYDTLALYVEDHAETFVEYARVLASAADPMTAFDRHIGIVFELRNCVFLNIMQIGWKINILSTGMPGMKYHIRQSSKPLTALQANPHVCMLIPNWLLGSWEGNAANVIPIVTHRRTTMSTEFSVFFNGGAGYRGA